MAVGTAPEADDTVPWRLPTTGSCALVGRCGTLRRSAPLPPVSATAGWADADLLALVAVLGRKYTDGTVFRVAVRRAGWPDDAASAQPVFAMPSELTAGALREAAATELAALGEPVRARESTGAEALLCVVDGAAAGRHEAALAVSAETTAAGVLLHVDVHEHLFDPGFADRVLGHLLRLAAQMTGSPQATVGGLTLLTDAESARLRAVNDTARDYPRDASVHALFDACAQADPSAVAVAHDDGSVTYAELRDQALRLAGLLHERGVGRHARVALMLERTPRLLVAVLAVLRLGAVYVPLAPDVPAPRREVLLADSGAVLLVTDRPADDAGVPVLDLTRDHPAPEGGLPPAPHTAPGDPAYVMYTSGTTGTPKGVLVGQRAVVRLVRGTGYLDFSARPTILQTGSLAFDATTFEYWGALLNGGTLVLPPRDAVLDAARLRRVITRHGVDTMFLTTPLFNQLVEQDPAVLAGCQVAVGGEALSPRHVARAVDACPDSVFVNVYGPTENTTFSTAHRITGREDRRIPIGRPIAHSTAYVLDHDGHPQPVGVPGELHVGGDGLSDGYLGRPDLDAQAFVHGGPQPPERLYRTGDLARWTPEGELDFLGRADHQVKIRGHRVEPLEVERHLQRLLPVREVAVLLRRPVDGPPVLTAYFTAERPLQTQEVRAALLAELPDYLVPGATLQLDALPLTPNQKVDRAALALREPAAGAPAAVRRRPRTRVEAAVTEALAEVLGVASVSIDDDFFELGGHSLLAMKLWGRLQEALGVEFPLRHVLDIPKVADLAASVERDGVPASRRPKLVRRPS